MYNRFTKPPSCVFDILKKMTYTVIIGGKSDAVVFDPIQNYCRSNRKENVTQTATPHNYTLQKTVITQKVILIMKPHNMIQRSKSFVIL